MYSMCLIKSCECMYLHWHLLRRSNYHHVVAGRVPEAITQYDLSLPTLAISELCRTAYFGSSSVLLVIVIVCLSIQITDPFRTSVRVSVCLVQCFTSLARPQSLKLQNSSTIPDHGNAGFWLHLRVSFEVSLGLKSGLDFLNPLPGWKFERVPTL